jgi:serine/threonine protein kinase
MYGMEMDIWGAGCIQFELTALYPLFPGLDEADQIHRIHNILGTPNDGVVAKFRQHAPPNATFTFPPQRGVGLSALLPDADERFLDILSQSVAYDVSQRITSKHALKHPYFADSISFSSGAGRVAKTVAKDKSRVAKNARGLAKVADSASAVVPVQIKAEAPQQGKQRSMVSLLLARVSVCADNLYIIDHIRFYQISHLHVRIIRRCSSKNQWQETKLFIEKGQIRITII